MENGRPVSIDRHIMVKSKSNRKSGIVVAQRAVLSPKYLEERRRRESEEKKKEATQKVPREERFQV